MLKEYKYTLSISNPPAQRNNENKPIKTVTVLSNSNKSLIKLPEPQFPWPLRAT
jgi:hypothetical protein